ncbi:MAG: 4Fe-4S binding protein [Candidatus Kapabacteria bacterium]|nr:4Fe-4S binding protein [Candidatus Kapabacteria bacterium]
MAKAIGDVVIDIERCKGCELCIEACPEETLGLTHVINSKGYHYAITINSTCTGCVNCALVCPEGIIKVYRKIEKKSA